MEPMIFQKTIIERLTNLSVDILKKEYLILNNEEIFTGKNWRGAYSNSFSDRERLSKDIEEPYLTAILDVWGLNPLVPEPQIL